MAEISSLTQIPSIEQLVSIYTERERKPIESLEEKKTSLIRKSAVLSDLKTTLKSLRSRLKSFTAVGTAAKLAAKTAVSSNESIFTVEADATASVGVNTIFVSRIAKNDLAVSGAFKKSSTSVAQSIAQYFAGDTLKFTIQIGSGSAKTISISFNPSESNEDLLERIAEAINNTVDDVSATVISSSKTKSRLTIVASNSGSENAISLSDVNGSKVLEELGFITGPNLSRKKASSSQGGYITQDIDDLDAVFEVNGIEITSSSNTIADVVKGVTIQLRKAQKSSDDPETFAIMQDPEAVMEQIEGFINEYNDALKFITEKTSIDIQKEERGVLAGNFVFTNLRLKLREIVSQPVSGVEAGKPSLLTEIGVIINRNGTLAIDDEDELENAIIEDAEAVTNLFTSEAGIAPRLIDLLSNYTLAGTTIDRDISSIRRQTSSVDRQISQFESRYRFREESLRRKFTELERALTLLNSQQALLQRFGFSSNTLFQFDYSPLFGQNQTLL